MNVQLQNVCFSCQSEIQECYCISQKSKNIFFVSVRNPRMFFVSVRNLRMFFVSVRNLRIFFVSVRNLRLFLFQLDIKECVLVHVSVRNPRMFLCRSEIYECVIWCVRNPRMLLYWSEIQECFYISQKSKNVFISVGNPRMFFLCVSWKWKKAITKEHGFSVVPWRNEKKISDTNTRIYIESKIVPKVVFLCRSEITLLMKVIPETCCAH